VDLHWLKKYSRPGPRYTSYPTAPVFDSEFSSDDYRALLSREDRSNVPLSLYFHIPFCESVCSFCACNVIYTRNRSRVDPYLDLVKKEMDLLVKHLDPSRKADQLHWGGGTPTFMSPDRMDIFYEEIKKRFSFTDSAEISIELDPREVTPDHIAVLRKHGFNRASLGVQDVDEKVQKAVNRIQPMEEQVIPVYESLRSEGFQGINMDLIYGLPFQTPLSFEKTVDAVISLRPDRISLFNFAYLPHLKKHQVKIDESALPDTDSRLEIFAMSVKRFIAAGYVYVGMDHFALPDDELVLAQSDGTLHRNFQGYTTRGGCDLLGIGVTSIGELSNGYAQNFKKLEQYAAALEEGVFPVDRGYMRSEDDTLRHRVIMDLISHFRLDTRRVEQEFGIVFQDYFRQECEGLKEFENDGLLTFSDGRIEVHFQGRFVIRNICILFDRYLPELESKGQKFSKTV
ncbi:MAG: oxygen-independent coproporphyrinogen III oxidase, partial [Spirochaetia bacterium]|nr:oxygen-independent coproporphyrinogen III oxidase [Spirochaetia bacterium]